jgi:hypothetical protein
VVDDFAVQVIVDVLAEVVDVAGGLVGREVVPGDLDQFSIFGLPFLEHAAFHAVDGLGFPQDRDGERVDAAAHLQNPPGTDRQVLVVAGGQEVGLVDVKILSEGGGLGRVVLFVRLLLLGAAFLEVGDDAAVFRDDDFPLAVALDDVGFVDGLAVALLLADVLQLRADQLPLDRLPDRVGGLVELDLRFPRVGRLCRRRRPPRASPFVRRTRARGAARRQKRRQHRRPNHRILHERSFARVGVNMIPAI